MNCARSENAAQEREEAVDVEVVERGLDLVEDVERARPGEEHGEQERERGQRLLAAGEQREALGRLARGRDLDLDAHLVLGRLLFLDRLLVLVVVGAAEHRARAGVLADEPQRAAAAREEVADDLLEVLGRGLERLLERLLDAAVGVPDQAGELAQRGLQVVALALELLDVLQRLLVLLLGQRVDRAELLAAALQALDPGVELRALAVRRAAPRTARAARPSFVARRLSSAFGVLRVVARLLRADLAAGDLLAVLLDAGVDARLLGRALAQLGGELLAGGAVGGQLGLEDLEPDGDRLVRDLQRRGEPLGDRPQRLVALQPAALVLEPPRALRPVALGALDEPLLGGDRGLDLRAALGARALVGRGAPLLDHPARVPLGLGGLVAGARGGARLAVDRVARRVGLGDLRLRRLDRGERGALGLRRGLDVVERARRAGCAR